MNFQPSDNDDPRDDYQKMEDAGMFDNKLPKLIGIHGHARAGKDTAANFLAVTYKDHYIESFAGPLKDAASLAFGVYRDWFDNPEFKEVEISGWGVTPRQIAQFMGTEMFRNGISELFGVTGGEDSNFWVKRLERTITNQYLGSDEGEYLPEYTVVIPDVRFQNEADWILANNGILIHLIRSGADGNVGIPGHASEAGIDLNGKENVYEVVNDGTIPELELKIANVIMASKY